MGGDPCSSSSKTKEESDEFEEVWSELHSLKKLYGILHSNSANNTPSGDHSHDSTLDEKSRLLLKKLLDGATHQALQSQTKIVCHNPGSTPPSGDVLREETVTEKLHERQPADVHHHRPRSVSQKVDPAPNQPETTKPVVCLPGAELKVPQKASAAPAQLDMKRQTSIKSTRSSHEKPQRDHRYRQIDHERGPDRSSSKLRSSKIVSDTPSDTRPSEPNISPEDGRGKDTLPPEKSPEYRPAVVVRHDKPRPTGWKVDSGLNPVKTTTKAEERLQLAKPQICQNPSSIPGEVGMKRQTSIKSTRSSHQKLLQRQHHPQFDHDRRRTFARSSSKLRPDRDHLVRAAPGSTRQTDSGDLLAVVPIPAHKRARVETEATGQTRVDGRVDRELTHSKRSEMLAGRAKTERGKSRTDHEGRRGRTSKTKTKTKKKSWSRETSSRTKCSKTDHSSYGSFSRTSSSSRTRSSSSEKAARRRRRMPAARVGPRRPRQLTPSHRREVGLPRREVEPESKEGPLKRLKNKLAIIFHHHHHHHHHIHDGANSIAQVQRRSPWKYLRGMLHRKNGEEHGTRVPARQGQRGYFHALLEGLIRHVWGTRRKKKVQRHRLGTKKPRWWRRGGVKLAKPRLRLGFNRINSQTNRKKTG